MIGFPSWRCIASVAAVLCGGLLSAQKPERVPTHYAIVGVDVLPMDREELLSQQTVVVRSGVIEAVGAMRAVPIPEGARVVDGRGRTLLPGLFDMHIHLNEPDMEDLLILHLAHGVTTVQSMHGTPEHLQIRERLESGELLGPRFFTTGPTTATERCNTPQKARELVRRQKAAGYDAIKMYGDGSDTMTPETYRAVIDSAHEAGLRVVGHAPRNMPFRAVLESGQDSIDHMEEIVYTERRVLKVMGPLIRAQFGRQPSGQIFRSLERIGDLREVLGPDARAFAADVKKAGLKVTPTLVTFETIWRQITDDGFAELMDSPQLRFVHPMTRLSWGPGRNRYRTGGWAGRLDAMAEALDRGFEVQKILVGALHDAGVPLMTGSDAPLAFVHPGEALHREISLLHASGLSRFEALRAATVVPAGVLGIADQVGTVQVGMAADLLLVEGNPLDDLAALGEVAGVFRGGRWLAREELDRRCELLAAEHEAQAGPVVEFAEWIEADELDRVLDEFLALDEPNETLAGFVEDELNRVGYEHVNAGRFDRAIGVFELNCAAFPESANVWDSLGEAHMRAGNREEAIRYYERCLQVDPDYGSAIQMLEKLRGQ